MSTRRARPDTSCADEDLAGVRACLVGERCAMIAAAPPATLAVQQRIWWLAAALRDSGRFVEVVPGMNNLGVVFDPDIIDAEELLDELRTCWKQAGRHAVTPREVEIPVRYGGDAGPDLTLVARHAAMPPERLAQRHAAGVYTVYFLGFQPGFAYMGGLAEALHCPRRESPRLIVPAGSVGIGGAQTGIYPGASPGGWQLIGRTDVTLFDAARESPALLQPGDRVRFVVEAIDA